MKKREESLQRNWKAWTKTVVMLCKKAIASRHHGIEQDVLAFDKYVLDLLNKYPGQGPLLMKRLANLVDKQTELQQEVLDEVPSANSTGCQLDNQQQQRQQA